MAAWEKISQSLRIEGVSSAIRKVGKMAQRAEIESHLAAWLAVDRFKDYGPNGLPGDGRPLRRLAGCSGGAQSYFEAAMAAGADAFITGEVPEPQGHIARETGVVLLACGHHATERYGAPTVAAQLAAQFGLQHQFIEIENPA